MLHVDEQDPNAWRKTGGDTQRSFFWRNMRPETTEEIRLGQEGRWSLSQEMRLCVTSHTQPWPGSGERQGWRGGKGHDWLPGMT